MTYLALPIYVGSVAAGKSGIVLLSSWMAEKHLQVALQWRANPPAP